MVINPNRNTSIFYYVKAIPYAKLSFRNDTNISFYFIIARTTKFNTNNPVATHNTGLTSFAFPLTILMMQ